MTYQETVAEYKKYRATTAKPLSLPDWKSTQFLANKPMRVKEV